MDGGPHLVVSEIFGPTFQGEGPSIGLPAGFVRLGRCNLACTWCDTAYTWDWARYDPAVELSRVAVADVLGRLGAMGVGLVVVSGGEPLLQQRSLIPLLQGCRDRGWRVEVETAGTIAPAGAAIVELVDRWNVSPKLAHSGNPAALRLHPEVLRAFQRTGRAVFKFVARDPADLAEVDAVVAQCGLTGVMIMPEGTDAPTVERRLRALAPAVLERRWALTTRLHVLLWGDHRGA